MENYIQYARGYQKDNIDLSDIKKAIKDVQQADDEHGAFWVSVIIENENVIETNKDLSLSIILDEEQMKFQATNWTEIEELFILLLDEKFIDIKNKIKTQ